MAGTQQAASSRFEDREGSGKYNAPRHVPATTDRSLKRSFNMLLLLMSRVAMTLADFELVQRLGDGSFSQVVLGRHKHTKKQYAIKIIDKHLILRHKQTKYIKNERYLLDKINSDSISDLYFTFQDENSLYLGLEYCPNGELYDQIHRRKKLDMQDVQFYAAEIVLMLRRLKQEKVVHRDLKPENLMLSASGHLKLIDFGSAKYLGEAPPAYDTEQQHSSPAPKPSFTNPSPSGNPHPTSASLVADSTAATTSAAKPATSAAGPTTSANSASAAVPPAQSSDGAQHSLTAPSGTATDLGAVSASIPTVHITGSSAAVPDGELPAKALQQPPERLSSDNPQSTASGELPGISARSSSQRATSFVGTADYVSPEVLNNLPVTYAADLWSLGCVTYQMLVGATPFKAATEYLTFQRISAGQVDIPAFVPAVAQDLLRKLLVPDAGRRLGADNLHDLMKHPFFEKIDWDNLRKQQAPKFLAPIRKTGDDNAVDWELRSLAAALPHHGSAVGNVSGHSGSAGHAGVQATQSQDSGPDTYAYMAAAAQMHAIMRAENEPNF